VSCYCRCPRCGDKSLERLETYSHCVNCLYAEDYWQSTEADLVDAQNFLKEVVEGNNDEEKISNIIHLKQKEQLKNLIGA